MYVQWLSLVVALHVALIEFSRICTFVSLLQFSLFALAIFFLLLFLRCFTTFLLYLIHCSCSSVRKDVLPTGQLSKLIYHFECRQCESRYVGRTFSTSGRTHPTTRTATPYSTTRTIHSTTEGTSSKESSWYKMVQRSGINTKQRHLTIN